jgi:hypothetical protein
MPSLTNALKIWQIGSAMANAKSRKTQFGMPSGPGDLWTLMRESFLKTSDGSMTYHQLLC